MQVSVLKQEGTEEVSFEISPALVTWLRRQSDRAVFFKIPNELPSTTHDLVVVEVASHCGPHSTSFQRQPDQFQEESQLADLLLLFLLLLLRQEPAEARRSLGGYRDNVAKAPAEDESLVAIQFLHNVAHFCSDREKCKSPSVFQNPYVMSWFQFTHEQKVWSRRYIEQYLNLQGNKQAQKQLLEEISDAWIQAFPVPADFIETTGILYVEGVYKQYIKGRFVWRSWKFIPVPGFPSQKFFPQGFLSPERYSSGDESEMDRPVKIGGMVTRDVGDAWVPPSLQSPSSLAHPIDIGSSPVTDVPGSSPVIEGDEEREEREISWKRRYHRTGTPDSPLRHCTTGSRDLLGAPPTKKTRY
ncbi:hypothetical protein C8J56DRAFT_899955 [Mycena floridula]|nr:hypothetical protein C8J56DRAFT_899955 [Mycena floridula]